MLICSRVLAIVANPDSFYLLVEVALSQLVVDQVPSICKHSFSELTNRIVVCLAVVVLMCSSASVLDQVLVEDEHTVL